ncbi:hypothetical protein [Dulcicalothrix desertica]|uniref:hypothetical protein n=1 Tax=Dulcicalothrix desertica TaxID=32056 RepID=UPI00131569E4|nr:hypothetical protein [Dulcicalothrix desertica]
MPTKIYLLIAVLRRRPEFIINLCNLFKVDETDLFVICACLLLEALKASYKLLAI